MTHEHSGTPGKRLAKLDWEKQPDGLLPAIVQDADTGRVLMLGYMNSEALDITQSSGRVTFYSRSRRQLWTKGETSGNHLVLVDVAADCDRDTLLVQARPAGPACHLGTTSCFDDASAGASATPWPPGQVLAALEAVVAGRAQALAEGGGEGAESSYTARLLARGPARTAQKVGEEGVEVALAVASEAREKVVEESADLLYHLLVALRSRGIAFAEVLSELNERSR